MMTRPKTEARQEVPQRDDARQQKTSRFVNPFGGVPKPFRLDGLFMLHPEYFFILHDMNFDFPLALKKRMERLPHLKNKKSIYKKIVGCLNILKHKFKIEKNVDLDRLQLALEGDKAIIAEFEEQSLWAAFFEGAGVKEDDLGYRFVSALGKVSAQTIRLWREGREEDAQSLLRASPYVQQLLPEKALNLLRLRKPLPLDGDLDYGILWKSLPPGVMIAAALESSLGYLPVTPAWCGRERLDQLQRNLLDQLSPECTPVQALYQWLEKKADEYKKPLKDYVNERTLRRWKNGEHMPECKSDTHGDCERADFSILIKNIGISSDRDYPFEHYYFAKHLNYLGFMAEKIRQPILAYIEKNARELSIKEKNLCYPFPDFPHDYKNFEEWVRARFECWRYFHQHLMN
jgi:hypothetical protein